ncbi:LysR family transcriptional regulator substrate-binding protein [Corynebacterium crudilactis]|uniref:LysR family transcriptional regulator n=1 Tax=Corynebacterium crudilactis TaxID=1652495 RepID=A0A172QSI9_9CORY|nr:LysR family transcriptional regulator substrate-binding protein [Corynebacterium crudilactis]ANE03620.1 LysR family transcriptional regulator [Corynebacterium crudilactis]
MLTLSFITGTEPGKWFTRFRDRTHHGRFETIDSDDALGEMLAGQAQLALSRLPDARIDDSLHVVKLYEESPGIAFPKDFFLSAEEGAVDPAELDGEIINWQMPDSGEVDTAAVRDALQIVAANVGVVIAPRPLLKVLSKKLVEHRELKGGIETTIALVWKKDEDSEEIQDFVGIARGRTRNSSRKPTVKLSAREKSLAKQARRQGEKPKTQKRTPPRKRPQKRR